MPLSASLKKTAFVAVLGLFAAPVFFGLAAAHGPGGHGDNAFTALQAVEKATALYSRLIADGKLDETWEIGLTAVEVKTRGSGASLEYVIRFDRKKEAPKSVYIFFNTEGKYTGSNFTGE